jgi:hypothetical protein
MKIINNTFGAVLSICILFIFLFLGSNVMVSAPSNAVVILKKDTKVFLAPPCINSNFNIKNSTNFKETTLSEARKLKYKPDNCTDNALHPSRSSIIQYTLEPLKIVKPLYRWDKDGEWMN